MVSAAGSGCLALPRLFSRPETMGHRRPVDSENKLSVVACSHLLRSCVWDLDVLAEWKDQKNGLLDPVLN